MKNVAIFGKNSYIGKAVAGRLEKNEEKYQVTVMDSRKPGRTADDFAGQDVVFHAAGLAHVDTGSKVRKSRRSARGQRTYGLEDYMRVNCRLALETAAMAKKAGVRQFIFMSSIAVYGEGSMSVPRIIHPDTKPEPVSSYGKSKLSAEKGLLKLADENFRVAIIRCPMVYGRNSRGNYPMLAALAGALPVFPDFPNERSMIYIGNLCEFVRILIDRQKSGIFFPQNRESVNTAHMAACIAAERGRRLVLTKKLNLLVRLAGRFSRKVSKAFGSLAYVGEMSRMEEPYEIYGFEESVRLTEGREENRENQVLLLASVASMLEQFNRENIRILQNMGFRVHLACNFHKGSTITDQMVRDFQKEMESQGIDCISMDFPRGTGTPWKDFLLYRQLKRLLDREQYQFVHCHSPIGSVIARLAGRSARTPVMYTAHGFQFFRGGPKRDWFLFYPVEKFLSRMTRILITINREDYALSKGRFHAEETVYVPGVGVDCARYGEVGRTKQECREALGIPAEAFVILSVGELCVRKNHETAIRACSILKDENAHYYILGKGELKEHLEQTALGLGIAGNVHLEGFRTDVELWIRAADIFLLPSIREGLALAGVEAMAGGLPLVASKIRGITDYAEDGVNGFLCAPRDEKAMADAVRKLLRDRELRRQMGNANREAARRFDRSLVNRKMEKIYEKMRESRKDAALLP